MRRTSEQLAELYGAEVELEIEDGAPPVINDPTVIQNVEETIRSTFGDQAVHQIQQTSMGGEDFAHYLQHVPGAFIRVGTSSSPKTSHPLHHHEFDIDEAALAPTARLMSRVLTNHLHQDVAHGLSPNLSSFSRGVEGKVER
jgi:metal-dependent amidase/aminoacylase/carboxypeptidase family protein